MRAFVLPVAVYALATALLTWPVPLHLTEHVFGDGLLLADVHLVVWILAWGAHALSSAPTRLFEANAFHPAPHVLAGSETLLGDQLVFLPAWLATGNPVLGLNLVLLTSFFLSGLFMHLLVRRFTASTAAAYVAGLAYAAGPWRMDVGRVHLLTVQYLPLVLLLLDRAALRARRADALLAAAVLTLQVLCSYYIGYMAYLVAAAYVIADLVGRGVRGRAAACRALAIALLAPALVLLPVSLPYLLLKSQGALAYEPRVLHALPAVAYSPFVLDLVGGNYVGWRTLALGLIGLAMLPGAWRADRTTGVRLLALALAALAGFALAHGSPGMLWGVLSLFDWLRATVPGFANVRSAMRFASVTAFAMAALAGFGVAALLRHVGSRALRAALATAAAAVVLTPALTLPPLRPWPLPTGPRIPAVYQSLRVRGEGGPLLELPIGPALGPQQALFAAIAMYHSIFHRLPVLNGHTGYPPPPYPLIEYHAAQLPSPESLAFLVRCTGLRWILSHHPPATRRAAWARPELRVAGVFDHEVGATRHDDWLYEVRDPRVGPCRAHLFEPGLTADGHPLLAPTRLEGSVALVPPSPRLFIHGESLMAIVLENRGTELWPGPSADPARRLVVTTRWEPLDGGQPPREQYLLVPEDVAPGRRLVFSAWVVHPRVQGRYRVHLQAGVWGGPHLAGTSADLTLVAWLPHGWRLR